jgi:hypothetical protein
LIAQYKTDTKQEKFEFGLLDVLSNFGFPKLSSASFEKNLLRAYGVATDPGQRAAIVKALGDYFSAKLTPQEEVFSLPPSAASSTSPEPSTPVKRAGSANATPKKSSTVEYKDGDEPSKQLMFLIDYSLLTITQSHNSSVSRIQAASVAEKICDGAQNIFRTQSKGKNRKDGLDVKAVEFCTKLLETTEQVSAGQKDVHVVDVAAQRALNIIISKIPLFDSSTEDKDTIAALVNTTWKACELISLYKKKTGSESEFDFNFFNNFHSDNETLRSLISNLLMVYAIAQRRCEDTSAKDPEENSKFKNDLEIFFATFGCYLLTTIQEVQAKQKNSEEMANRLDAYDTDGQLGAIWVTNNYRILQFGMSYLLYEMSLPLPVADSSRIATQAAVLIKVFCENASGIFLSNDEEGRALAGQAIKFCETILGSIKPSSSYEAETCVNTAITCVNTAMYFLIFSRITSLPSELSPANDSLLKDHIKYAFSKVKEYNEKAEQKFNLNLFDDPSSIGLVKAPETSRAFRQKLIHGYALLQADGACKKDAEDFLCTSGEYLFDKELQKKIDSEKGEVTEDELIFAMNYLVYKKTEAEKALKEVKNHSDFGTALNDSLICGAEQRLDGVMQMARALMVKIYGFHGDNQDVFAANSELKKASEDFCFAMFQDADYVKDYFADKSNSDDDSGAIANAFRYFMGQLVQCKQKLQVTPAFASPSGETHSSSVDSRSYGQIVLESLLLRVKPSARSEYSCSYEGIELLLKSYAGNYATEKCKKGDDNKSVSICLASRALGVGLTGWADLAENLKPPVSPGSKASATEFTKMQTPDFTQLSNLNKYVDVILQGYPRMESGAQEAKEAFIRQNIFAFLKKNPINIADIPQICQLLAVANVDIGDYFSPKLKPEEIGWLSKEGLCGPFAMIYYESQIVLQKSSIIRKRRFNDFCKFCRNTNTDPEFLLHNFDREAADYLLYCCQLPDSEKAAHFGKVFNKYPPNSCNIGKFEKLQVSFEMISPQAFLYYKGDPKVNFEKISPQAIVVEQILGSSDKLTDPKYLPQKIKTCMQNALIQAAKESSNDEAKIFLLMVSTKLSLLSLFPIDKKEVDAAFTWLREKCGSLAVPGKCWGASEKEMFVAAIFAQEPFTEEHFAIFKQLNIEPGTLQSAFSKLVLVDKSKGSKIALFLLAKSENDLLERLDRIVPPETDIYIDQGNFKSYPLALFNMIVWHNHIIAANPNTAIRESIVRNLCEVDPQFYVNILRNLDITKHNSEGAVKELFDCFCSIAISTKDQCLRKKVDQIVEAINAEIFNPALQKEIKKNYEIYQYRCNFDLYFGKRDFEKILKIQEAPEAIEKQQFVSKILYFLAKEHIEPSNVQGDVLVKEYLNYLNNLSKNQPDNRYHELLVDILKFGQLCETFNEIAVKLLLPILQERLLEDPSSKIPLDDVAKFYCSLRPEFRGTEKAKLFANRLLTQADVLSKLTSEVRTYFLATFRTDLEQQGVPEAEIRQQLGNWFRFLANLVKAGTLRHPVFAVHEPPFNFVYIDNRGGSKELRKVIVDADLVASFNHSIVIWGVQQEDFADIFARLPGMMSAVLNEEGQYKGILPALRGQHVLKLFLLYNTLAATDQDIRTRIVEIFIMGICKPNDEVALEAAYNLLGADNLFDISTSIAERIRIHHSETADDRTNALNNVSKLGSFGALILVQLYLNEDNEGYSKAIFTKLLEDPLCLSAVNYLSDHKNEEMSKRLFYALCLRKSLNLYQPDASIKNVILPYWNHLVSDKQTAEEKKIVDDFVKDFKVDELKNYCELCKQDAQNGLFALLYRQFVLFDTQVRSCPKSTKDKNEHVFEVLATQGDKGDINFLDFVKDNLDKFTSSQVQRICGIIWQSFLNKEESKDIAWFNANILPIYRSFMENHPRTRFINGDAALTPLQFKYLIRIVAFIDLEKQAMPGGMRVDMHVDPLYGALLRELILRRELTREGADLLSLSIAFNTAFVEQLDGIPQSEEGAGAKQVQLKERMHDVILFIASEYLYNREMSERDRKLVKQFLGNVLANLPQPFASEKGALQTEISKAEGAAVNAAYDFIYDRDWYSRSSAPVENDVVKKKERAEQFIDDTYVHSPDGALSRNIRIYRDYKVQRIVQPNLQLQYEANEKDPEDKNLAYSQLQSVQAMVASQRASASNSVLVASTASGLGLRRQPSSREQQQSNSSWFAALRSYAYYWIESAKTWRRFSKLDSERAKIFQDEEVKKAEAAEKPVRGRSTDARVVIGKSSARSASPSPVRQPVASGSGTGNRSPSPSGTRRKALPPLRKSTLLPPAASSHALSPGDDRKVEVASSHDPKGSEKDAADASDHVVIHKSREETRPDSASPVLEQSDKPINTGSIMKSFDSGSETGRRSPLPPLRRRSPSPSPTRVLRPRPVRHQLHSREGSDSSWSWHSFLSLFSCLLPGCLANVVNSHNDSNGESKPLLKS